MAMNEWIDRYPYVKALLQQRGDALLYDTPEVRDAAAQVELPQSSGSPVCDERTPWDGLLGPFDTWRSGSSDPAGTTDSSEDADCAPRRNFV